VACPPPYAHQQQVFDLTKDEKAWALFFEQRCGKTRPTIETVAYQYRKGAIKALIVIADNGVHANWATDELPNWIGSVPWRAVVYNAQKFSTKRHKAEIVDVLNFRGLKVLCITYDAAITENGKAVLWSFLKHAAFMVADESIACKSPTADRTKILIKAARFAKFIRILNGTPVDRSPFDVYSQIRFLDPDFWKVHLGIGSYGSFKAEFAEMITCKTKPNAEGKSFEFETVKKYKHLDVLRDVLKKISSRVTRDDVFDLPPNVYGMRSYEMSPEQKRIYAELKTKLLAELGPEETCPSCGGTGGVDYEGDHFDCLGCGGTGKVREGRMSAVNAGVRLMRLQQVLNGYQQVDGEPLEDIPGPNRRLEALEAEIGQTAGPWIIWGRFQRDIDKAMDLVRGMGLKAGAFDGRTPSDERTRVRQMFQAGEIEVFIGNPGAAGKGIRLTAANSMIYYANSFRLLHRLQSEDRAIAADVPRTFYVCDINCKGTFDDHVIKNLRSKIDVASQVTGDRLKVWLA